MGGGVGAVQKKNSCTPINPKKHSCHGLKLKFIQGIRQSFEVNVKIIIIKRQQQMPSELDYDI